MDALSRYILDTAGEPWRYRVSDCAPWMLRWVMLRTGRRAFVPHYGSRETARQVIYRAGGNRRLMECFAARLAVRKTQTPVRGDVGLIRAKRALTGSVAAICLGPGRWAVKMHSGRVVTFAAEPVVAWRIA